MRRLAEAFDRLPERCRQVVWLRRVEDLPQKQVALRMGITEKTVEKQIAKGMRLLAEHYYGGAQALAEMEPASAIEAGGGPGTGRSKRGEALPPASPRAAAQQVRQDNTRQPPDDRNRGHGRKQTD
ncbi:sigma-70 family RNA polymerase sigma factor [Lysobacter sp. 2RAB21]